MKKTYFVLLLVLWLISLVLLISTLVDLLPNNPVREYSIIVGLWFIAITRIVREGYKKLLNH